MPIRVYISSVSPCRRLTQNQKRIEHVLISKKIPFEVIDLSCTPERKDEMRENSGNPAILPPQVFNGNTYCGGFEEFDDALEDGRLKEFLGLQ